MESVRPRAGFSCSRADAVSVRLAKGERESVQILVTPKSRDLKDVGVEVKMHDEQFASTNIASAVVGYVLATNVPPYKVRPTNRPPPLGWWPDPILDFQKSCDVSGDDVQSFWLRVTCPRNQKPGTYGGVVSVSAKGEKPVKLPIVIRVNDFEIGKSSPLPLAITCLGAGGRRDIALKLSKDPESYWNAWRSREAE